MDKKENKLKKKKNIETNKKKSKKKTKKQNILKKITKKNKIKLNKNKKKLKKKQPKLKKDLTNKKIKSKKNQTLDYDALTINQIQQVLNKETYKEKYVKILKSTIYSLVIIAAIALMIATMIMPVLQISGNSMTPTYNGGEIVLSIKTNNLKPGDVIAFYHGNKILVKRVIAGAGNWINIDESGQVYVNGYEIKEEYVNKLTLGETDIDYPYQVPDGHWFVLSDNRSNSIDSRNKEVGSISKENIIGKVIFQVWPIKK